ncbi:translocation protein sec63 [Anaeramoeba flamelloides]|uniref:Translocation protein sec63 n=1 Tax=Anaeramoeba flamelloides TaxID=1746091 RepID=A0AAV7ZA18_9EUKA|nr:translocation protein sec63 [Anaeramoeba flamelloides]
MSEEKKNKTQNLRKRKTESEKTVEKTTKNKEKEGKDSKYTKVSVDDTKEGISFFLQFFSLLKTKWPFGRRTTLIIIFFLLIFVYMRRQSSKFDSSEIGIAKEFKLLGLDPSASDDEIWDAYAKILDKMGDVSNQDKCNSKCRYEVTQANLAYQKIQQWKKQEQDPNAA